MSAQDGAKEGGILAEEYQALFQRQWAPWIGGILLGIINVLMFAYVKPWAVADGVRNWGQWVLKSVGLFETEISSPFIYTT